MAEGAIFHSCGHSDMWRPVAGWPLYYKDYTVRGNDCIGFGTYCLECYLEFLGACPDQVFMSWNEAEEWLSGNGVPNGSKS